MEIHLHVYLHHESQFLVSETLGISSKIIFLPCEPP